MFEGVLVANRGEIAIVGPEMALSAVCVRKRTEIDDEGERRQKEQRLREDIDAHRTASEVAIDGIIPPRTLGGELTGRSDSHETVEMSLLDRKRGTILYVEP